MLRTSEIPISGGPEIEICMLLESPGPKSSTLTVEPRLTMVPVLSAEPWGSETSVAPSTCAFSAGLAAAAETVISVPETDCPAASVTTAGGLTPPTAGVGVGVGLGLDLLEPAEPEPQPVTVRRAIAIRNVASQNTERSIV